MAGDPVNIKERVLPVFDKHYHTNTSKVQSGKEIEVVRNFAFNFYTDKRESPKHKHSLHGKTAAPVLLKLLIGINPIFQVRCVRVWSV